MQLKFSTVYVEGWQETVEQRLFTFLQATVYRACN